MVYSDKSRLWHILQNNWNGCFKILMSWKIKNKHQGDVPDQRRVKTPSAVHSP